MSSGPGYAALERGDYATAHRELLPLAKDGDAEAQYILGVLYGMGHGDPENYDEARNWWLDGFPVRLLH